MQFEPKLREHKVVPLWTLPDKHGDPYNLAKKRGSAHFLLLVCAAEVDPAHYLESLAPVLLNLRSLPAQGIVVVASEDIAGPLPSPPFVVVIDTTGGVRERFLPTGAAAGLFALDRYGDLYHQWLVERIVDLPAPEEVEGWMQAIGMQCSL
jgi:hypothetical protein